MKMDTKKAHKKARVVVVSLILALGLNTPVVAENLALPGNSERLILQTPVSQPDSTVQAVEDGMLGTGYSDSSGWCQPFVDLSAADMDVTITGFEVYFKGTLSRTINVYYKSGSHVGSETTPGDWTSLGTANVTPGGDGTLTSVPIGGVTIPAGQTYGFYFWDGQTGGSDGPGLAIRGGGTSASNGTLSLSSSFYTCNEAFTGLTSAFGWQGNVLYGTDEVNYETTPVPGLNTWGIIALIGLLSLVAFPIRRRHQA